MRRSSLCFICYRSLLLREKWMHLVPWKKPLTLFQSRLLPFSCDTCRRWLPSQLRRIQPSFSPFPWTFCPDFSQVKANDSTGVMKTGMSSLQWFTFDDILRAVSLFFFRFSEGSARASVERWSGEKTRETTRAWSFSRLSRFARRTKIEERLLVVYFDDS